MLHFTPDIPCPEGLQLEGVAMKDLLIELQELTDWFKFGVEVGVQESKLKEIRQDYEDTEECKSEMLLIWMNKEVVTWTKVIRALVEIGMERLALAIASKYGTFHIYEVLFHFTHKPLPFSIVGIPQGVAVPPSLQESLDNLKHDVEEVCYSVVTSLSDESELVTFITFVDHTYRPRKMISLKMKVIPKCSSVVNFFYLVIMCLILQ